MVKKKETRLGSDPLKWIEDSRGSKQKKPSKLDNKNKSSISSNKELHKKEDKPSMSSKERLQEKPSTPSSENELKGEWVRASFIIRAKYLEKIKAVGYWDRKQIKEVMDEALEAYLAEKKVEPIAKKKRG